MLDIASHSENGSMNPVQISIQIIVLFRCHRHILSYFCFVLEEEKSLGLLHNYRCCSRSMNLALPLQTILLPMRICDLR
jgi:hypothetical protein